jgi:hypothetical protein
MRSRPPKPEHQRTTLENLREAMEALASPGRHSRTALQTGWREVDDALSGGLAAGAIHEWFGLSHSLEGSSHDLRPSRTEWTPPLMVLVHLAARAQTAISSDPAAGSPSVLWIGTRVWPYGHALLRASPSLWGSSICVDAPGTDERFWATDAALRSAGTSAIVVADGSGLSLAVSRRLQLAAETGGTTALLARPPWEESELSVAATRWRVCRCAARAAPHAPRWSIELVRCKGSLAHAGHAQTWTVEHTDDGRLVSVPPELVNRTHPAALAS